MSSEALAQEDCQFQARSFFREVGMNTKYGAELASTTAVKTSSLPGVISPNRIIKVSANDNFALVAANDNNVVAARLAA